MKTKKVIGGGVAIGQKPPGIITGRQGKAKSMPSG